MNCFTYTVTKRQLKKMRKEGILSIPIFKTQILPVEGDRVYLNNFDDIFVIEKVTPTGGTLADEVQQPYFEGYFDLALHRLYTNFSIISVTELHQQGELREANHTLSDAADLYMQSEAELAFAEGRDENKAEEKAFIAFWHEISHAIDSHDGRYEIGSRCVYKTRYDVVLAYLDDYDPLALMLFYREHNLDYNEAIECIPAAYVDMEVAEQYGLTTEDLRYIVEGLFCETMLNFDPETAVSVLENPMIVVPKPQVVFYKNLIEGNDWRDGEFFDGSDGETPVEETLGKIAKEHSFSCVVFN